MMPDHFIAASRFFAKALVVWADAGVDRRDGDFVEALTVDGTPLPDLPRRGRTQARQILTFAMAHALGDDADGRLLAAATRGYDTLRRKYMHRDGGLLMAVHPDGTVADGHRYAYEQAFLLMAEGWLHRATGDARHAAAAEATWQWLQETLLDREHDGFRIGVPDDRDDPRQQNPHMHLFEACLLNAAHIGGDWRRRADWLYGLFVRHFYDAGERCLHEFFRADWSPHPRDGDRLDPGHHFEWTWLLGFYARMTGTVPPQLTSLYRYGERYGLNARRLGRDEIYPRGRVLRPTSRLWVQCEVTKGHLTLLRLTGNPVFLARAQETLARLVDDYLRPDSGCWYDQLDDSGAVVSENSPASTLYHLYVAFAECRAMAVGRSADGV